MPPLPSRTARVGFTIVELMVTIALMAILAGVLAPNLRDFILNMRLTGDANDLMTDLMLARSEAVKRVTSITVCGKKNSGDTACGADPSWTAGWLIVIDANQDGKQDAGTTPIKLGGPVSGSNTLTNTANGPNKGTITYSATGIATTGIATLALCDTVRSNKYGRVIDVSAQGRARVIRVEPKLENTDSCK
jgi:type IV fimbrial biogenesis protein FimT